MAVLMSLALCGAACQRRSAAEGRMQSIEINRKSLRSVQGRMVDVRNGSQQEVPYTAFFQQMDLQLIEEQREGTARQDRFYFVEGKLFSFREMEAGQVARQFIIDRRGNLVGTRPAPFPPEEYQLIAARADRLKDQAMQRAGHMFVFPLMRNR